MSRVAGALSVPFRAVLLAVAGSLAATLVQQVPALAERSGDPGPSGPAARSVAVGAAKSRPAQGSATDGRGVERLDRTGLPAGGSATVTVSGSAVAVGGLLVSLSPRGAGAPSSVLVHVADQRVAMAAGVHGAVLALSRADGKGAGRVRLRVDFSSFANAFGADFGNRLHLVRLPGCVLASPERSECQRRTVVPATNRGGAVSAEVDVSGGEATEPAVFAVTSGPASGGATFTATDLSPAFSWSAGNQGGTFSWSYPLRVPPSLGGPAPELTLGYDSGAVDGQTLGGNGQASAFGEGFGMEAGYVERSYRPCKQDGGTTGDLCWFSPYNATLVWGSRSSMLVRDKDTGVWHSKNDDGLRVEQVFGVAGDRGDNGTHNKEYWKVTTQDGTEYFFGVGKRYANDPNQTQAALSMPVYGNHAGEPCYNAGGFALSWCKMGYRWYLDMVRDPRANTLNYYYQRMTNRVGANNNTNNQPYDMSARLNEIWYGMPSGQFAPMKVQFSHTNRCIGACVQGTADYPDTPWDLYCTSTTSCPNTPSPVFFSPFKVSAITTQVLKPDGVNYRNVDRWDFAYTWPSTGDHIWPAGDDTTPNLWLQSLQHTGYAEDGTTSLAEPAITFGGTPMFNRKDWGSDVGVPPYTHYRLTSILNGTGGQTQVTYKGIDPPCATGQPPPNGRMNATRCFPVYFTPVGSPAGWGWFHKYIIDTVTEKDLTGGAPDEMWSYEFTNAASTDPSMWHYDYNETVLLDFRCYCLWRGYTNVRIKHGPAGGPQTVTDKLYYRGMDGDTTEVDWGLRRVNISDSQTTGLVDHDGLQGFLREETVMDGATTVVSSTIHEPTVRQTALRLKPIVGGQDIAAFMVRETRTRTRTSVWSPTPPAWRWTQTDTTYDAYGLVTDVRDSGDVAVASDDTCTHTDYARDTTKWFINYPYRTLTTTCTATPGDTDYLAGSQTYYDGSTTSGTPPTKGLATKTEALAAVSGGVLTWKQTSRSGHDSRGRVNTTVDALDRRTSIAHTPATNLPVTSTVVTNPKGWTTTTTLDPGKNLPTSMVDPNSKTTTAQYDPLGRLLKVWLANRATSTTPDQQYVYTLSATAPNWVETRVLGPAGNQTSSFAILDGRLRPRQTQTPTPVANGGRMIADTTYDNRGLVAKTSTLWNNASGPSSTLVTFADSAVPTQQRFSYDNLERQTADAFWSGGAKKWETTTHYQGDRTSVHVPTGGTATASIFDARGLVVEQRQHHGNTSWGTTYSKTFYGYDRRRQLTRVTNDAGSVWTRGYDLRGRLTTQTDPDAGATTNTYDDAGQLLTTRDASNTTLAFAYDPLGRRTGQFLGSTSGTKLADWTFDTLAKGQLTNASRYQHGGTYTTSVTGYDDSYRPLGSSVTIPASEGDLAGTWTTGTTYRADGSVATMTYPAVGGLTAETVTNTYDNHGYQLTATGAQPYLTAATYQPWGDPYQLMLGTGGKRVRHTTDVYPDTRRLKSIAVATENQTTPGTFDEQLTQQYLWDPAGNLTTIDNQRAGAVTDSQCFRYDHLRQLADAWTTTPAAGGCATAPSASSVAGPDAYWTTWTYDNANRRTNQTRHGLAGAANTVTTHTYPTATAARPHALSSTTTTGPGAGTSSYTYNNVGQTTRATTNGQATDYTWTPFRRVNTQTVHATGGDQTTTHLYTPDGALLLQKGPAGRTLYLGHTEITTDANGVRNDARRYYTAAGRTIASRAQSGTLTWRAPDHHGTAQITIHAGTLQPTSRRHDPYGNPRGNTAPWIDNHGYLNGTNQPDNTVQLGARHYQPATGQFLSPDELIDTTDPQTFNAYTYATNNPTTRSDPTGLRPDDDTGGWRPPPPATKPHNPPPRPVKPHRPAPPPVKPHRPPPPVKAHVPAPPVKPHTPAVDKPHDPAVGKPHDPADGKPHDPANTKIRTQTACSPYGHSSGPGFDKPHCAPGDEDVDSEKPLQSCRLLLGTIDTFACRQRVGNPRCEQFLGHHPLCYLPSGEPDSCDRYGPLDGLCQAAEDFADAWLTAYCWVPHGIRRWRNYAAVATIALSGAVLASLLVHGALELAETACEAREH